MSTRKTLEAAIYTKTHRDYKLTKNGQRYILVLDKKSGVTTLLPLADLTTSELQQLWNARK